MAGKLGNTSEGKVWFDSSHLNTSYLMERHYIQKQPQPGTNNGQGGQVPALQRCIYKSLCCLCPQLTNMRTIC